MTFTKTLPILIGGVILLACTNQKEVDRNKGEILSVLINETGGRITNNPFDGAISHDTATILIYHKLELSDFPENGTPCEFRPLREELLKSHDKDQMFDLDLRHLKFEPNIKIMISNDSIMEVVKKEMFDGRKKLGVNSIIVFSKVIFNKEMDMAIVGFAESEALHMAYGMTYFFRKIDVTWTIVETLEGTSS